MLSNYYPHNDENLKKLCAIGSTSLIAIRQCDENIAKLSTILDEEVEQFLEIKSTSKTSNSNSQGSKSSKNKRAQTTKKHSHYNEIDRLKLISDSINVGCSKKVDLAVKTYDLIDENVKLIDHEILLIEKALLNSGDYYFDGEQIIPYQGVSTSSNKSKSNNRKRKAIEQETVSSNTINNSTKKEKAPFSDKSKTPLANSSDSEPVYCFCKRVAFGAMIACDNDSCPVEWFHYACVNIVRIPQNSWLCPLCKKK
eukprot:gene5732-7916_t